MDGGSDACNVAGGPKRASRTVSRSVWLATVSAGSHSVWDLEHFPAVVAEQSDSASAPTRIIEEDVAVDEASVVAPEKRALWARVIYSGSNQVSFPVGDLQMTRELGRIARNNELGPRELVNPVAAVSEEGYDVSSNHTSEAREKLEIVGWPNDQLGDLAIGRHNSKHSELYSSFAPSALDRILVGPGIPEDGMALERAGKNGTQDESNELKQILAVRASGGLFGAVRRRSELLLVQGFEAVLLRCYGARWTIEREDVAGRRGHAPHKQRGRLWGLSDVAKLEVTVLRRLGEFLMEPT